jgi:small subunit ribosomal protein S17
MPKRVLQGKVVSKKNAQTVIVEVVERISHKKYNKISTQTKTFVAHNTQFDPELGAVVSIVESRAFSKTKKWLLLAVS